MTADAPLLGINVGAPELIMVTVALVPTLAVVALVVWLLLTTRRNRRAPDT